MENGFRADLSWLEDPQVFQVGRLDAHSDHCWFESEEDLKGKGRLIQSLNGEWKFAFSRRPADRPEEFYQETYDDSAFGTIQAIWRLRGMEISTILIPCTPGMDDPFCGRLTLTGRMTRWDLM